MTSSPVTGEKFLDLVRQSGLVEETALAPYSEKGALSGDSKNLAAALIRAGLITQFQAKHLLTGRYRGLILGHYKLLDQLGKGGMGTVYLAEHRSLKRKAAVKVLSTDLAKTPLAMERFYREARAAAALSHPNIVRVYDVGQFANVHYISMEYVEGQTLSQMIEKNGPLHFATACDYIAQAAAGLQEAYEKGLVHRDIKPENLIVDKSGTLKILDMGLARSNENPEDRLTAQLEPDVILGTADYIAPEQALNQAVDIRADIYSLGVTFFAILTGRPPFTGTTAQKLVQHQLKEAPSLSALRAKAPVEVGEVISRMLQKKPADRYQTPAEVIEALAPWLSPEAVANAQPSTVSATMARVTSRTTITRPPEVQARPKWFWPAVAGGGVAAVAVVGLVIALASGGKSNPPAKSDAVAQAPPAPAPVSQPAVAASPAATAPKIIYRLDLTEVEPFKLVMEERNATEIKMPGKLPVPWRGEVYKSGLGSVAELRVEDDKGKKVLTQVNVTNVHIQFFTAKPIVSPKPGHLYKVRVEYKTGGTGFGEVGVRNSISGLQPTQRITLVRTDGEWRTEECVVDPDRSERPMYFFIQNLSEGVDNPLFIRSFEVIEQPR